MSMNLHRSKDARASGTGVIGTALVVLFAGCSYEGLQQNADQADDDSEVQAAPAPAADPRPPLAVNGEPDSIPEAERHAASSEPATPMDDGVLAAEADVRAATPQPRNPQATAPAFAIELKRGVALAQTLPNGTAMGFSIDYRFLQDGPRTNWQYVLLYQAGDGRRIGQPVPLEQQGTLQQFVGWRPEDGPFYAQILGRGPDGTVRPLSPPIELRE